jgi:hypothetical protein
MPEIILQLTECGIIWHCFALLVHLYAVSSAIEDTAHRRRFSLRKCIIGLFFGCDLSYELLEALATSIMPFLDM